jgi:hypothetical protein
MKRKATPPKRKPAPAAPPAEAADDSGSERIVARPDGFHWLALDGRNEFGPFETIEDARADMLAAGEEAESVPGETLQEAEDEIGIADWIDPDTGEPAEGHSPPHLEQE